MITPHYPPEFGWYGPGRDSMELALDLAEKGHQLEVIACADKLDAGETYQDGIKVIRVSWTTEVRSDSLIAYSLPKARLLMTMNMSLWEAFLQVSKKTKYDIIDTSGISAESLIPSILSECPVVARVHDCLPDFLEKKLSSIGDSRFRLEQQLADFLTSITNNYLSSRTTIGNAPAATDSVGKLNYSLDTESFSPEGLPAIDTQGRPSLLVHTSIDNEKYKTLLSEVVKLVKREIPDLWLTVVAHDIYSESSEGKLREALAKGGIVCDLVINQNMSRLLMPGLWRTSWCGLILDWQQLYPYAVLEPLACGCPIVVETQFADMGFLSKTDFLYQPREFSAEPVAERIIALLKDENLRKDLGAAARDYVTANHCRKANGERIYNAYKKEIEKFKTIEQSAQIVRMERLLNQCRSLTAGIDRWLYDLLFLRSFRFRLSHWLRKLGRYAVADHKEVAQKPPDSG